MPASVVRAIKPRPWALWVFWLLLVADLTGLLWPGTRLHLIAKPLLMPALFVHLYLSKLHSAQRHYKWVLGALAFSWLGDVLLMLDSWQPTLFLGGLSAFLMAHILYIIYFRKYQRARQHSWYKKNAVLVAAPLFYGLGLLLFMIPRLGSLTVPVIIYCAVILTMLLMAMGMQPFVSAKVYTPIVMGAILFVLSDTILALNKFVLPLPYASLIIMLTYGLAQVAITTGAVRNKDHKLQ